MSKTIKTIEHSRYAELVIECPNRCQGMGCEHDVDIESNRPASEWRKTYRLPPGISVDYALTHMERYAEQYPKSGPYRLVEYVTETTTTLEVLG